MAAPEALFQGGDGHDVAQIPGQRVEQPVFGLGENDLFPIQQDLLADAVECELADLLDRLLDSLGFERSPAQLCAHTCQQFGHSERFGDVVVGSPVEAAYPVSFVGAGGQHQDRDIGELAQLSADLEPIEVGQHDVEQHKIWGELGGLSQGCVAIFGGDDCVAAQVQVEFDELPVVQLIVDHQDSGSLLGGSVVAGFGHGSGSPNQLAGGEIGAQRGSCTVKVVPLAPGKSLAVRLTRVIVPWWARTISRQIVSPSPIPLWLRCSG